MLDSTEEVIIDSLKSLLNSKDDHNNLIPKERWLNHIPIRLKRNYPVDYNYIVADSQYPQMQYLNSRICISHTRITNFKKRSFNYARKK